jgi:hypothetical protein
MPAPVTRQYIWPWQPWVAPHKIETILSVSRHPRWLRKMHSLSLLRMFSPKNIANVHEPYNCPMEIDVYELPKEVKPIKGKPRQVKPTEILVCSTRVHLL